MKSETCHLSLGEANLRALFGAISSLPVTHVYVDALNPRPGVWACLKETLNKTYPEIVNRCRQVLYKPAERAAYLAEKRNLLLRLAREYRLQDKLRMGF